MVWEFDPPSRGALAPSQRLRLHGVTASQVGVTSRRGEGGWSARADDTRKRQRQHRACRAIDGA